MKRNILYVENGAGFGGAVTCLAALISRLNKSKYRIFVISSHNDYETRSAIEFAGAEFIFFKKYKRLKIIEYLVFRAAKFMAIFKFPCFVIVFLVECLLKLPFFIKVCCTVKKESIDLISLNNDFNVNFESLIAAKFCKKVCILQNRGPEYPSVEARFFLKFVDYFLPMSKYVEQSLLDLGVNPDKVKVVYDGISIEDSARLSRSNIDLNPKSIEVAHYNVGLFGCLLPWKGQNIFIEAANILISRKDLPKINFFIIGDTPSKKSSFKLELVNQVQYLDLSSHVFFLGHQDNVFTLMEKMHIVVHTSVKPEPFGRVIIEAMSLGKPVIATNMGGPLEIIHNQKDGILIPPNEPLTLADAIKYLLLDAEKRKSISEKAKKNVFERFDIHKILEQTESIYDEVVK